MVSDKIYCIYIITNKKNDTLYIGVTSDLVKRIWEHKEKVVPGFTNKYNLNKLVYYEMFGDINYAIHREKRLKKYKRIQKLKLINEFNPEWEDLYNNILG